MVDYFEEFEATITKLLKTKEAQLNLAQRETKAYRLVLALLVLVTCCVFAAVILNGG